MLSLLVRLFALRPLLSLALFGVPVVVLIALGLAVVATAKLVLWVAVPALLIWLLWRLMRQPAERL